MSDRGDWKRSQDRKKEEQKQGELLRQRLYGNSKTTLVSKETEKQAETVKRQRSQMEAAREKVQTGIVKQNLKSRDIQQEIIDAGKRGAGSDEIANLYQLRQQKMKMLPVFKKYDTEAGRQQTAMAMKQATDREGAQISRTWDRVKPEFVPQYSGLERRQNQVDTQETQKQLRDLQDRYRMPGWTGEQQLEMRTQRTKLRKQLEGLENQKREMDKTPDGMERIGYGARGILGSTAATPGVLMEMSKAANQQMAGEEQLRDAREKERALTERAQILAASGESEALRQTQRELMQTRLEVARLAAEPKARMDMESGAMAAMGRAMEDQAKAVEGMSGTGQFLAQTAMSIADNAMTLPLAALSPGLSLAAMGAKAAASSAWEQAGKEKSAGDALRRGLTAGAIEALTEKLPLDSLVDMVKSGGKAGAAELVKQVLTEAGEEGASYLANLAVDKLAADPEANFSWAELGKSMLGGAISGGVMGTGATLLGATMEDVEAGKAGDQGKMEATGQKGRTETEYEGGQEEAEMQNPQTYAVDGERMETEQDIKKAAPEEGQQMETGEKGTAQDGNEGGETARYSIVTDQSGKKYVQADRQVITGDDPSRWGSQIINYINRTIRQGKNVALTTDSGDVLLLTRDTAGKAAFRNLVRQADGSYAPMTDEQYAAKLRAEGHIDELAQISVKGKKTVPDAKNKHGELARDGWNYRTAYFKDADGQVYRLRISVAMGQNGNTVYNVGVMEKRNPFSGGARANVGTLFGTSSRSGGALGGEEVSNASVPQQGEAVNEQGEGRRVYNAAEKSEPTATESQKRIYEQVAAISGEKLGASKESVYQVQRMARATGVPVRFGDLPQGIQGEYKNGIITISSTARDPAVQIWKHELTHHLESSGHYEALQKAVMDYMESQTEADMEELRQVVMEEYEQAGMQLDEAGADREIVAKFVESRLFQDQESINRLAVKDRGLFQQIYQWVKDMAVKLTGTPEQRKMLELEKMYEKALRTAESGQGRDAEYYIAKDAEGNPVTVVNTDQGIFAGVPVEEYAKVAQKWINEKYKGKTLPLSEYDSARVNKKTAGEYTHPQRRLNTGGPEFSGKMKASTELENLLEASEYLYHREDAKEHAHREATDGWDYYKTTFIVDGQLFEGKINIATSPRGRVFYDMTDVKRVADTYGKYATLLAQSTSVFGNSFTESSIAQRVGKDNRKPSAGSSKKSHALQQTPGVQFPNNLPRGDFTYNIAEFVSAVNQNRQEAKRTYDRSGNGKNSAGSSLDELLEKAGKRKGKAQNYQGRKEREFGSRMAKVLDIPGGQAGREHQEMVHQMAETMKEQGRLTEKQADEYFEQMWQRGMVEVREHYDAYKDLKEDMKKTPLRITGDIKDQVGNWKEWEPQARQVLNMKNGEGISIDERYQELLEQYPELFPEGLTSQADQLKRMAEVAKGIRKSQESLDSYYGQNAWMYKEAARQDYDSGMKQLEQEMEKVKRYEDEQLEKKLEQGERPVDTEIDPEETRRAYKQLEQLRREADRVKSQELLTEEDRKLVDKLLQGEKTVEEVQGLENVNVSGILRAYEAMKPMRDVEAAINRANARRKEGLRKIARARLSGSDLWKDKTKGLLYSTETMERNFEDIMGKGQKADGIIKEYFTPVHEHEAAATQTKNMYRERVRKLELSRKESEAVQFIGESRWQIEELERRNRKSRKGLNEEQMKKLTDLKGNLSKYMAENKNLDMGKIDHAIEEFHAIYDELFKMVNDTEMKNGYKPSPYRKGYFPHFQEQEPDGLLGKVLNKMNWDIKGEDLPTEIMGLTDTFRPGRKWFGNLQERKGVGTVYDAVRGFDSYIETAADVIWHTEDIQKLRALENELRYKYSEGGVKSERKEILENPNLDEEERARQLEQLENRSMTHLGNLAMELRSYTDSLAGKKDRHDRGWEQDFGRGVYTIMKGAEGRVAANMVGINPASWLTNGIPIAQAWSGVSTKNILRGMGETVRSTWKNDGLESRSAFLTNRRGSDRLYKTTGQKIGEAATKPMEWIDLFTSQAVTRARYYENLDKGMTNGEALREADRFAANVIADRSKGALPTVFNRKNPIAKVFSMFQVEVNNQWRYFKDLVRDQDGKSRIGAAKDLAWGLTKYSVASWIYNSVYEELVGRRPALDPIDMILGLVFDMADDEDKEKMEAWMEQLPDGMRQTAKWTIGRYTRGREVSQWDAVSGFGKELVENLPFVGGFFDGGRVPISSALPDLGKAAKTELSDADRKKKNQVWAKEMAKPLFYIVPPMGGGQLKKAVETAQIMSKGGRYTMDNEGRDQLQYAQKATPGEIAKSLVFGPTSTKAGKEWVAGGFKSLKAGDTETYRMATEAGIEPDKALEVISTYKALESQKDEKGKITATKNKQMQQLLLEDEDLTAQQKSMLHQRLIWNDEKRQQAEDGKLEIPDYTDGLALRISTMEDGKTKMRVRDAQQYGLSEKQLLDAYDEISGLDARKDADGFVTQTKKERQREAIMDMKGLNKEQKTWLDHLLLDEDATDYKKPDRYDVDYSSRDMMRLTAMGPEEVEKYQKVMDVVAPGTYLAIKEATAKYKHNDLDEKGEKVADSMSTHIRNQIDMLTPGKTVQEKQTLYEIFGVSKRVRQQVTVPVLK